MTRFSKAATFLAALLLLSVPSVRAERQGDQGVGVMLGAPSGFSYKSWVDEDVAIDAALGVDQSEFDMHADLLWHNFSFAHRMAKDDKLFANITSEGEFPFYFGFGPRVLFKDKTEVGIRFPLGMAYMLNQSRWEFFMEVAPIWRLTPSSGFNGDFGIGARYYFPAVRSKLKP